MKRNELQASRTVPIDDLPEAVKPTERDIASRAYDRYLARGRTDGQDVDDWLAAEQELATERRQQLETV
jgi:hypothetical protein